MTKAIQKRILNLAKDALYHRRNNAIAKEQAAFDRLQSYLDNKGLGVAAGDAIEQARQYLSKTSAAAIMNGITGGI